MQTHVCLFIFYVYTIDGEKMWLPEDADDKYMYYRGYAVSLNGGWNLHLAREQTNW